MKRIPPSSLPLFLALRLGSLLLDLSLDASELVFPSLYTVSPPLRPFISVVRALCVASHLNLFLAITLFEFNLNVIYIVLFI